MYFPYIDVPKRASLFRVLLYWDYLGSIVPQAAGTNRWTRSLIDAGLVRPVSARQYVEDAPDAFADGFADLLDEFGQATPPLPPVSIHIEKTDGRLLELLISRGFATLPQSRPGVFYRGDRHLPAWGWIDVDGFAGALYMAYLAVFLAQQSDLRMEPITDEAHYFNAAMGYKGGVQHARSIDDLRAAVLRDVLPAPSDPVNLRSLVSFKERHDTLLRELRREVEARVLSCAREPDPEFRRRLAQTASEDLRDRAEEVARRMAERRWPTAEGVICSVLQGTPAVAGAVATGEPAIAAAGAVPLLVDWIKSRFPTRPVDDDPVVYAVLAGQRFP